MTGCGHCPDTISSGSVQGQGLGREGNLCESDLDSVLSDDSTDTLVSVKQERKRRWAESPIAPHRRQPVTLEPSGGSSVLVAAGAPVSTSKHSASGGYTEVSLGGNVLPGAEPCPCRSSWGQLSLYGHWSKHYPTSHLSNSTPSQGRTGPQTNPPQVLADGLCLPRPPGVLSAGVRELCPQQLHFSQRPLPAPDISQQMLTVVQHVLLPLGLLGNRWQKGASAGSWVSDLRAHKGNSGRWDLGGSPVLAGSVQRP